MNPLAQHLRKLLAAQVLGIAIALTALLQVLELLDVTSDILERGLGVAGVFHYMALRLPSELVLALPLAALIGSLFTFYTLARNHEMVAIRAAGLRVYWVVGAMLPVMLVFAVLQFVIADRVVPRTEAALTAWWDETTPAAEAPESKPFWARTADGLLWLQKMSRDGRHLEGLRIFRRDAQGQYAGRIDASSADWEGSQWRLHEASELQLGEDQMQRSPVSDRYWLTNLRPADLQRLNNVQPRLSSGVLVGLIAGKRVGSQPSSFYRTALYHGFIGPLGLAVMLLLALPATRAVQRGGQGGGAMLAALGAGLAFVLVDGLMASLGSGGRIPPLLASVLPFVLFAALGLVLLRHYDRA